MRQRFTTILAIILVGAVGASAGDLYKVTVGSQDDAYRLIEVGCDPLIRLNDGYLIMVDGTAYDRLESSGLPFTLIAADVKRENLALDGRRDRLNVDKYPLVFEQDDLRLLRVDRAQIESDERRFDLFPVGSRRPQISYSAPRQVTQPDAAMMVDLDSLIANVSIDSLSSYVYRLQDFQRRVAGTDSSRAARDWIQSKFIEFGYDSVYIDTFVASLGGTPTECYNVVAVKPGTVYPNHQVVIGAHHDAVEVSPGADDNGSGTAGVLEMARILKDAESAVTRVFVTFDAEEWGLLGAWHFAGEADGSSDTILYMHNMDMIGYYENISTVSMYTGSDSSYAELWSQLADSLLGVSTVFEGQSSRSDHYPFTQYGIPVSFIIEYAWSTVYHTAFDSTSYISFDYMTLLVKASTAAVYVAGEAFVPRPLLQISFPQGLSVVLTPDEETVIDIDIAEVWGASAVEGSPIMFYSIEGGASDSLELVEVSPEHYQGTLPACTCGTRVTYSFRVEEVSEGMFYSPAPDAEPYYTVAATGYNVLFEDDFETDKGWSVSGTVSDGHWSRGVPAGGGTRGDPPTDYDGSGQCYLTDNVAGNSDVDGGFTLLTSPVFDATVGNARVEYARWFCNDAGDNPYEDTLSVNISANNGVAWTRAETIGPSGPHVSGGWYLHGFWISDFLEPTNRMRLRYEACDVISGSVVEAAVDAVSVTYYDCSTSCCQDLTGNVDGDPEDICDIGDLTYLIDYLFISYTEPTCPAEANIDGIGTVDMGDLTKLIDFLFISYAPPAQCSM
ncbi:MAG: M28 family peptidase [Candidatus Zixiibacteriota bacterium]|nr:MAG: M28 family peptidase [candidate division Zixibacteria bacterium]